MSKHMKLKRSEKVLFQCNLDFFITLLLDLHVLFSANILVN